MDTMPDRLRKHHRSTAGATAKEAPVPGEDTESAATGHAARYMICDQTKSADRPRTTQGSTKKSEEFNKEKAAQPKTLSLLVV